MSRVAVIGEEARVGGFVLAGALVFMAEDAAGARAAWRSLPPDVAVAVLTPRAVGWLRDVTGGAAPASPDGLPRRPGVLPVVMPPEGMPPEARPPEMGPAGETPPGETPPGETRPGETPPGETPSGETPTRETPP
jgi:hypothetical protein